ncbi:MAG: HNH endonuclease signature motif containing protein [bacterium]|nr:HNH endonuclease signature motif containing protein [bacterium]
MLDFKYKEDKQYFADLLADGSIGVLEKKYALWFDFRSSGVKRKEYNTNRNNLFKTLIKRAKGACQICKKNKGREIDHKIPLSSNQFNKKFRGMMPTKNNGKLKKVPSESYGSNNIANLQLACKSCNRKKWHLVSNSK